MLPERGNRGRDGAWRACAACLLVCLAGGAPACSRPGQIFDPPATGPVWPPPPDRPRLRYVGELRTSADLKPGRNLGQGLGEVLFGKEPARSMLSPLAVCTDGAERVFVADSNAQLVHVFDLATRRYAQWQPPKDHPPFAQPVGLAFDSGASRLLVADSAGGVIVAFGADGRYLGEIGADALERPCGVAVDRGGRIFVADAGAHQIVVLGPGGAEAARLGGRGSGPGEFNFPTYLALDGAGNLYVSDSLNFRVQVFGPDLRPLMQFGQKGDMPGYFSQPKGIAVDSHQRVLVVDANFEAVQIFDERGRLLMSFGREGHGAGEFWLPAGVHADPQGRIWIADSYNRRVQVFTGIEEGRAP